MMKTQVRNLAAWLLASVLLATSLAGCTASKQEGPAGEKGQAPSTEMKKGGTFTFLYTTDPTSLDPHKTPSTGSPHLLIYDSLVIKGPDLKYYPHLAESWQVSDDGKVITFKLRQGITFHNGEPFNAESVKFTFDRAIDPETKAPQSGGFLGPYEKTEIVSDHEIRVHFKEPYAPIFQNLSTAFLAILPPKAVMEKGDQFGREPVGTGPFRLIKWQNNDSLILERNPDWRLGPPWAQNKGPMHLERVIFKYIPDENTQLLALQNGEIDILDIPGPQVDVVRSNPGFNFMEYVNSGLVYLGINSSKPPYNDVRVRQAIASMINREEVVQNALFGMAVPNYTPISPSVFGYDPNLKSKGWPQDLQKAQQLLTEAGYQKNAGGNWEKNGAPLVFEIMTYTTQPYPRVAEVVQNQISKLGIEVKIRTLESASLLAATPKGEHDSILIAYGWADPDILFNFLHSSRLATSNRVHYVNSDLDQLLETGRATLDLDSRMKTYLEAQTNVLHNAPWVPIYTAKFVTAVGKEAIGVSNAPDGTVYLYDAYKEVK
jgi:peptide/nickel transport system substrate-binding protein